MKVGEGNRARIAKKVATIFFNTTNQGSSIKLKSFAQPTFWKFKKMNFTKNEQQRTDVKYYAKLLS